MLKDLTIIKSTLVSYPVVKVDGLNDFKIPVAFKAKLSNLLAGKGYVVNDYTSFAVTESATDEKPANFAVIPNQYLVFASQMYDFAIELYKYFVIFDQVRGNGTALVGNAELIHAAISNDDELKELFDSENDIVLFSKFLDKDDSTARLGSKRLINDEGRPRGSKDCFGSVVLKEINLPDASSSIFGKLVFDLVEMPETFGELRDICDEQMFNHNQAEGVEELIVPRLVVSLPKPFLLLAGISGTGKTRFVREQARKHDEDLNNFCLVPVRPDWHEPSDLLGYETQLSGKARYVPTDVIKFIVRAWQVVAPQASKKGCGDLNRSAVPYWLCLDEMNLAPVEQYFADYLSVLESREFRDGRYACDALITQEMLQRLQHTDDDLKGNLGLEEGGLWQYFLAEGISLPPNLIVAGTVNMDETTHGFSRKVIDRAVTLDFGEFFPNDYRVFFNQTVEPVSFSWSVETHASLDGLAGGYDGDGNRSIEFLTAVNAVLKRTPFELAYRALNELLLLVASLQPATEIELQAVWDDFLMTKVLPRIEGDDDKLRCNGDSGKTTVLEELEELLAGSLNLIWEHERKDFYRVDSATGEAQNIQCRSRAKLRWMRHRLEANTFTSFWP